MITLTREEAEHVLKLLDKFDTFNDFTDVRQPLRAKLSEPEPEPVGWMSFNANGEEDDIWYVEPKNDLPEGWTYKPLYAAPPQRKECLRCGEVNPAEIHTCTPQREWVGLTVDEFYDLDDVGRKMILEYGRLVEAKLREKNAPYL